MIRNAGAWDARAIRDLWNLMIRDGAAALEVEEKTENELVRLITARADAGHGMFVSEEEGEVLGFALYGRFGAGTGYAQTMEHTIIVAEAARSAGRGRALLAELEAHAKAAGAHAMLASVSAENEAGAAFHKALGYNKTARLKEVSHKLDRWIDLVLLQKFL